MESAISASRRRGAAAPLAKAHARSGDAIAISTRLTMALEATRRPAVRLCAPRNIARRDGDRGGALLDRDERGVRSGDGAARMMITWTAAMCWFTRQG